MNHRRKTLARTALVVATAALAAWQAAADNPPVPGGHPRLYLQEADLPAVQAKLSMPEFADAWSEIQSSTDPVCLAFVYLVQGDEAAGRAAVTGALDELGACDDARVFNNPMHKSAIVYDWCYDLMTDGEKSSFIAEFERIAAIDPPYYPAEAGQGAVVGHSTEGWLMTDQIPAGIAIYDESAVMYDAAATVFFAEFVPVRNYLYPASMHHQGDSYTGTRFQHDIGVSWIFRRLGAGDVFTREQQAVPYQLIYHLRPDGQQMRSGDTYDDPGMSNSKRRLMSLTGSYYEDPYLLFMADSDFFWEPDELDLVLTMAVRPPGIATRPIDELPLTRFFPEPMGEMLARTGWTMGVDSPDAVVHMRIGGTFFGNHQRKDFGTFQVYYRGALAIASGVYEGTDSEYGSDHWRNYYHQTIAHNGLLIFDPSEVISLYDDPVANDGGQLWPNDGADHPRDLETLQTGGYEVGDVTAHELGPDAAVPDYSYIAGDVTRAYSPSKVSLVTRSMVTFDTFDATYPAVLVVFDRVVSTDPSFSKTWLLHSIQEPDVAGSTISIVRSGPAPDDAGDYGGRLVAESLLPEGALLEKVGGSGHEFWVESTSTNYWTDKESPAEPGAWRVEVTPAAPAASDRFLHVLSVMDEATAAGPGVSLVDAGSHVGAAVLDRMVLFGRDGGLLSGAAFEVPGSGPMKVLVCDLEAGWWDVTRGGETVATLLATPEGTCIYFQGEPGSYTVGPGEQPEDWVPPEEPVDAPADAPADATVDGTVDPGADSPDAAAEGEDGGEGGKGGCGCRMVHSG